MLPQATLTSPPGRSGMDQEAQTLELDAQDLSLRPQAGPAPLLCGPSTLMLTLTFAALDFVVLACFLGISS